VMVHLVSDCTHLTRCPKLVVRITIPWEDNFSNSAYFSFVTLTTLGYGDISLVTPIAKTLVYLESVVGVFYMAVVVSSLVSSNLGRNTAR
ncbi:potassium channel family protein, partial [Vibrio parahaemolyticus]|uniref:potassium channel family protein n=1 Tax=Vibrio parahaemolyticus TaxID=670 RepID=UPI000AF16FFD